MHELYIQHAEAIKTVASSAGANDLVIIMGDFNIPSACWNFESGYYVQSMNIDRLDDFLIFYLM